MKPNFQQKILSPKIQGILQWASFVLLLLGSKIFLIAKFGNATPYWDQWDAEGLKLYQPFLTKSISAEHIFALHNEHRIVTTRLLALLELGINGVWNPLLQMVVNSILHAFTIGLCILLFAKAAGIKSTKILMIFALVLFSLPYAWENTLAGFQSQFYFVVLFNLTALWLLSTAQPFSKNWWLGLLSAVFAFFSLASGVFSLAAAAGTNTLIYLLNIRRTRNQIISVLILAIFFILGALATPSLVGHAHLKAASLHQFLDALLLTLGWPNSLNSSVSPHVISVVIRNLPMAALAFSLFKNKPETQDRHWFLFSCALWVVGTAASISYGRAVGSLSPRYLDLFAISVFINFACLITLVRSTLYSNKRTMAIVSIWSVLVLSSAIVQTRINTPNELAAKHSTSLEQEKNTRNYILTGDIENLRNKPFLHIPYPDPDHLATVLDLPELRRVLPANIVNAPEAISKKNVGRLDPFIDALLENYFVFYIFGFLALGLLFVLESAAKLQARNS